MKMQALIAKLQGGKSMQQHLQLHILARMHHNHVKQAGCITGCVQRTQDDVKQASGVTGYVQRTQQCLQTVRKECSMFG